jgi:hypothetical protein
VKSRTNAFIAQSAFHQEEISKTIIEDTPKLSCTIAIIRVAP